MPRSFGMRMPGDLATSLVPFLTLTVCGFAASALGACGAVAALPVPGASRLPELPPPVYAPADTVARFAPGVISNGDAFSVTFTRDGRTAFFTRVSADRTRMSIMQSQWTGERWATPTVAPFSTGVRQMDPHVDPTGKALYFTAPRRRDATGNDVDTDYDTWWVTLDRPFDPATRDPSLANSREHEEHPSLTVDSTLYFEVRYRPGRGTGGREIRYSYEKVRTTPVLVDLGREVRDPGSPYITPDGRVLLFSATSATSRGADLFLSVRREDGRFMPPQHLGREVNGPETEYAPSLSPDGRYLFFSRIHDAEGTSTGNDIYVVPVRSVPVLRDALGGR